MQNRIIRNKKVCAKCEWKPSSSIKGYYPLKQCETDDLIDAIQDERFEIKLVPDECPYKLEHIIINQKNEET